MKSLSVCFSGWHIVMTKTMFTKLIWIFTTGQRWINPHTWRSSFPIHRRDCLSCRHDRKAILLIHFRYSPNTHLHYTKVWNRTYRVCDAPRLRSTRCGFAPLPKSRRHNRCYVWTEPYMVWLLSVPAQKLSSIVSGEPNVNFRKIIYLFGRGFEI